MDKKAVFNKIVKDAIEGSSPEALEMRKIMLKMIKSEYAWAKEHQNDKVCSKCGRVNSQE